MEQNSGAAAPNVGAIIAEAVAPAEALTAETGIEPVVEAKPEIQPDKFASKFAALTRKEKEIRQREQAIVAKLAEAEKREKEWSERSKQESELDSLMRDNPLKALREKYGYDFEKLAEMQLNDENPTMDMKLDRRAKEVESKALSEIEALKKQINEEREAAKAAQYEAITKQFKVEISTEVKSNPDAYELILANEAESEVFDLIEAWYNQTTEKDENGMVVKQGEIMSVQDAAKHVEEHFENEAKRILKLKKFSKQTSQEEPEKKAAAPTLSNDLVSESPKNGSKYLSDEESKKEAAKLIRFNS